MGHKVHPKCFRLGQLTTWSSKWVNKNKDVYREFLKQDISIRDFINKKLKKAGVVEIEIERMADNIKVIIQTTRPGSIIGREGQGVESLKKEIWGKFFKQLKGVNLEISVQEVKNIGLSSQAVAQSIVEDIEKRISYRRIMKRAIEQVKKAGGKGVKIKAGGRLDGAEIARQETLSWGKIPLHTLRADIDYARKTAFTTYGTVGIKVWIYKGDVFKK